MKNNNIALIGFMGAGKSMVSNKLASLLGWDLISTDVMIEEQEKSSIAEIFEKEGEAYFRRLERQIVERLSDLQKTVIDCGGGIVLNQENIDDLKKNSLLVHLHASTDVIYQRVKRHRHRPLLIGENPRKKIEELLIERQPFYHQADYSVCTENKTAEKTAEEIKEILEND